MFLNFPLLKCPPMASLSMSHSSWPLSHTGIGGTNHVAYYKLPGWFRDACLLPEGPGIKQKQLHYPSLLPSPTVLSSASASLQLPSVWGLGAATRKQSPEAPGQELLQAWLTAWGFTLCLIEYSYCCTKSCHTFAVNYTGKTGNAYFLQGEINAGLFASDELDRPLIAGGLAQIWCGHPGFWLKAKQCVIVLRGAEGAAVRPQWIPLNRCWACPDQSYWEKR